MSECPNCSFYLKRYACVEECSKCGIGRTNTRAVMAAVDSQDYAHKSAIEASKRLLYFNWLYNNYIKNCMDGGEIVLDIGSADGIFLRFMSSKGLNVKGVEPSRNIGLQGCPGIINISFEEFESQDRYDLITMIHVLEHIADPIVIFNKCKKLLKNKGKLFIAVPNYDSWWSRLTKEDWPWLNPREHFYHYTMLSLQMIFRQQGFKLLMLKTHSPERCPSILNVFLSAKNIYNKGFFKLWPFAGILFRVADLLRKPSNFVSDILCKGAEIHALVENA